MAGFSFMGSPRLPCNRSICLTIFERLPHSWVQPKYGHFHFSLATQIASLSDLKTLIIFLYNF
jgi:hypothetical protein